MPYKVVNIDEGRSPDQLESICNQMETEGWALNSIGDDRMWFWKPKPNNSIELSQTGYPVFTGISGMGEGTVDITIPLMNKPPA